ncbi:MAG: zinc-ribbon domain-containing protein [Pseudomonadota bacterium]
MRLICPNCSAQYDVDGSMIPETGRDVQCSNCGHGWFQHPENYNPDAHEAEETLVAETVEPEGAVEVEPPSEPASAPPPKPKLDPTVTDVLRAEAERETAQRRAEEAVNSESQPDLGLEDSDDQASSRNATARARMARLRGLEEASEAEAASNSPRGDLLPNVDEINSTLRGQSQTVSTDAVAAIPPFEERRGGFKRGFYLVLFIAIVGVVLYVFAPQLAQAVPTLEPTLAAYVEFVNGLRTQVNGAVDVVVARIRDVASGLGG